jgi:hypothetical protein
MSIHDCLKLNGIQDRLQGFAGWEGKQCEKKGIEFVAMFKERQSKHFVVKILPSAYWMTNTQKESILLFFPLILQKAIQKL